MKGKWFSVVLAFIIGLAAASATALGASPSAGAGDVLIVEVGADPASAASITEPAGEFFEIFNNTASTINLNGWKVSDNSTSGTMEITLPSIELGAGKILVVIADAVTLGAPNGYGCAVTPLHHQPAAWFNQNLSNSGDRLILKDELGNTIDALSYGTDTTVFDPAAPDVFDNSGKTLQRMTYNTDFTDTDTAADWAASSGSGSPCDVGPNVLSLRTLTAYPVQPGLTLPLVGLLTISGLLIYRRRKA